jgi:hypothetical protein
MLQNFVRKSKGNFFGKARIRIILCLLENLNFGLILICYK